MPHSYNARHSLRLKDYDYSQAGTYFVTICTSERACVLGRITKDAVDLSEIGQMAHEAWTALPSKYPGIDIDAFIVMPNHVHGIVVLDGSGEGGQAQGPDPTMTLPQVMHRFKSFTTSRYRTLHEADPSSTHSTKLWQRNYHDHIIRDDFDLARVRQYILDNPLQWQLDAENPDAL